MRVLVTYFGVLVVVRRGERQMIRLSPEDECRLIHRINEVSHTGGGPADVNWILWTTALQKLGFHFHQ